LVEETVSKRESVRIAGCEERKERNREKEGRKKREEEKEEERRRKEGKHTILNPTPYLFI
jgi:hypothetical protein